MNNHDFLEAIYCLQPDCAYLSSKIRKTFFMGVKLHKIPKIGHFSKNRQSTLGGEPDLKVVYIN